MRFEPEYIRMRTATEIRAEFLKAERIVELVAVYAENPRRGSCVWR